MWKNRFRLAFACNGMNARLVCTYTLCVLVSWFVILHVKLVLTAHSGLHVLACVRVCVRVCVRALRV
jgi:hypothetical protein